MIADLWWLAPLSLVLFFGTLLVVPLSIAAIPADYFLRTGSVGINGRFAPRRILFALLRNLLGLVVVGVGALMLVTPGQGVLTILIGLTLISFPGKRALELRLIRRPGVYGAVNWIRRRAGKPALLLPP